MATNQTVETNKSVSAFIKSVKDETKRKDSFQLIEIMSNITKLDAKMWGPAIVGFGSCHYVYESGREGDMPLVAFSPRANGLVLYLSGKFEQREELLQKLGKHKTAKACLYIKKLEDVNMPVLKKMITNSVKHTKSRYPVTKK